MLFIHCELYPMEGPAISDGWIETKGSRIEKIGEMPAPSGCGRMVDCKGAKVYPGFVDAHTHLGMWEDALTFEGDDGNEETDPVTPQLRAIDAVNPRDRCFTDALEAGITTVVTGPGSANPIGGQMAALKTYGDCIDEMIVKAPLAIKMALGENPKTVYHGKDRTPSTRMATAALIREELFKAQRYLSDLKRSEKDEDIDPPEFDIKSEALIPALQRKIQVHFHAHRADDIFTAIRIAEEFHLDYVIIHGTEGYEIAKTLQKKKARILSGPFFTDRSKPELHDQTPANPGILEKFGIPTAIVTDHPVIPLQYLTMCAGLAMREGMSREGALRAITLTPAEICGISDRVGSLLPGKDADLVFFFGDPLSGYEKPAAVVAGGKIVFEHFDKNSDSEQ
ncbi:amidohydrolase [Caproicibacterium sp. NSD3]